MSTSGLLTAPITPAEWFAAPLGRYVLARELEYVDNAIADVFGFNALQLGLNYARENLKDACGLKAKRAYAVGERIFMEGNAATALGAVYGGASVCAGCTAKSRSSMRALRSWAASTSSTIRCAAAGFARGRSMPRAWLRSAWRWWPMAW